MAGSFSNALENDVLKAVTGQTTSILTTTPLSHVYVALFTGTLSGDTPGTEVPTTNGYARTDSIGKWAAASSGSVTTNAVITFPTGTGSWASGAAITHIGLFDAATGGNALAYGDVADQTKTVGNGDTLSFQSGSITITLD